MMNNCYSTALVCGLLLMTASGPTAVAQEGKSPTGGAPGARTDEAALRRELSAEYQKLARAIKSKDIKSFAGHKNSGFTVTLPNGETQTGEQVDANMRKAMAGAK